MRGANRAFVVHRTATRIRIKIPERQRQEAYFAALQRALLHHPDVLAVHTNALAASVAIECRDGSAFLAQNQRFPGAELLPVEAYDPMPSRLPAVDYETCDHPWPAGALGLGAVLVKLLVACAMRQLGTQVIEWVFSGVVRAVSDEARSMTAVPRLQGRPTLLVAVG